jgi:hypothetical protein
VPLVLLGLIAIVAALLLVYYSRKPGSGASDVRGARRVQVTVVPEPEKRYRKSEDGKVVYLFDDDDADDSEDASGADDDIADGTGALDGGVDGMDGDDRDRDDDSDDPAGGDSGGDGKERR